MKKNSLQEFSRDAIALTLNGWKLIDNNRPSIGVYGTFLKRNKKALIVIFPSISYPIAPPLVVFVAESYEFFQELSHQCLWSEASPFVANAPDWLRNLFQNRAYLKKFLHIDEEGWKNLTDAKNRLIAIHNFIIGTLKLKPVSGF
ncbi:MAG: hypothetical protein RMH75_07180 [Archaeoglobaceae archaeon]|nr:hypothetical protein [Archaeoglobaceae archaeon]